MLGRYENFPEITHGRAQFTYQNPIREVQQAVLRGLHRLNRRVSSLDAIASYLSPRCEVGFEFGIAEDVDFNYLDRRELPRIEKHIAKEVLQIMDFFCAIHYHIVNKNGKRAALRFDYHLIRFAFHANEVELRVHHERGPRRVPLDELIDLIISSINEELAQEGREFIQHGIRITK